MLQSNPTKKGTGIMLFGDYSDFRSLYNTINKIISYLDNDFVKNKSQIDIISYFTFEIRKTYEGKRSKEKFTLDFENKIEYYTVNFLWTDFLFVVNILRYNAAYIVLNELDQANLYLLEYNIKKSLFQYDPKGANQIEYFIGQRIDTKHELSFLMLQAINHEYLSQKGGKMRFRNIPNLIIAYNSPSSTAYKLWKEDLEKTSNQLNCKLTEIEYEQSLEIKW